MKKFSTKNIAITAVFIALTAAATLIVRVPTVATEGYVNVGDSVVMLAAVLFGPFEGFLIGSIGSCLSDLISGYAHWIFPTFLIKGAEGFFTGALFAALKKAKLKRFIVSTVSSVVGGGIMVAGYFFASWIMKGSAAVALSEVPANCIQWGFGVVLAQVMLFAADKTGVLRHLNIENNFSSHLTRGRGIRRNKARLQGVEGASEKNLEDNRE